ncbi:hypothetical protein KCU65_g4680, partial [Aureobasidium melanogenum]
MNALDHWYASSSSSEEDDEFECDKCDRTFSSWDGCKQHMTAVNHWFTDVCDTCDRRFVNRHALEQHLDAVGHRSSHYCSSCDRHFQNPSDLFQHLNSPIHQRANTTHAAPAPPVRSTTTPKSAPTTTSAPVVPVPSTSAVAASLPSTRASPHPLSEVSSKSARLSVLGQTVVSALTAFSTFPFSSSLPSILPTNTGTVSEPFSVSIEKDTAASLNSHYQSITFMQRYLPFSFEELRFADYTAGRKPTTSNCDTNAFGQSTGSMSDSKAGTVPVQPALSISQVPKLLAASAPTNTYQDRSTQTDFSRPESSVYFSATSSRATTPDLTVETTPSESSTAEFSVTTQKVSTPLAVEDNTNFHQIYEACSSVMKLVKSNDGKLEWVSQGYGPTRILVSKETLALRVCMHTDPPSRVHLDFDVLLDPTLYVIKAEKMVRLDVLVKGKEKTESFMCRFEDEFTAQDFLNELHKAIAKAQASTSNSPMFSLSEIKVQETEPLEKLENVNCHICRVQCPRSVGEPQIVNCPFCRLGFYTVSEVLQHLETTSCRARPDLNRVNIYHYLRRLDTPGYITESFSDSNASVPSNDIFLYRCPDMTGKCQGKRFPSFAALHAHLESEDCDFDGRSSLLRHIRDIEQWVPTFASC